MIQIRPSQLSDLDRLMEIFDHARKFMASVGNGNQWINGYPQRELIAKEITDGHCYACEDEHGKILFCSESRSLLFHYRRWSLAE